MAKDTLGARIINPAITEVKIFDQLYKKNARVEYIDAYSGHADMDDLDHAVTTIKGLKHVILVHGEQEQMEPFAQRLMHHHITVSIPGPEEVLSF